MMYFVNAFQRAHERSENLLLNLTEEREKLSDLTDLLKMNIGDVDEKLSARDFYGKVIERLEEIGHTHVVCFTSVPLEVDAYLQPHRQPAAKSAAR